MSNDSLPGLIVDIEASFDKFEQQLEEKFMPALAEAIREVVGEFLGDDMAGCVKVESE
jgi:flagellar biosynthesis/type III secretory pathway protein FliH